MNGQARLVAKVHGRVQRVGFRAFVLQEAGRLDLAGYVRNLAGGRVVEVEAEGERERLEELLKLLYTGPLGAIVERVEAEWAAPAGYRGFDVKF
ncbi:MAG: acylphosphatase [Chloroflexi bacterium]|nr:acylphosphatase [Chloroflexota bacterium]